MTATLPTQLKAESFHSYPPEAQRLAIKRLELFRQLPLVLLPLILREAINYEWRFPAERRELDDQLAYLKTLSKTQLDALMTNFARLTLSSELAECNWIETPSLFSEKLSAHLWATHQIDDFRSAAKDYAAVWMGAKTTVVQPEPKRLAIVVIGQGVATTDYRLFRKLRPRGVYFSNVTAQDGLQALLTAVDARATAHAIPYGHWYIDGGVQEHVSSAVTSVSYGALQPARIALLSRMQHVIESGSSGPEALRTMMAQMKPQDIGLSSGGTSSVLDHFQLSLLAEGSGTQIFSTTFTQWAARETLRRAQPETLLVRFAPRQRQQPMNQLLSAQHPAIELDPEGSLIDADMAAYYTWLNLQRLSGAENAAFLGWFEGHNQAVAIAPSLPLGTVSSTPTTIQKILEWIS